MDLWPNNSCRVIAFAFFYSSISNMILVGCLAVLSYFRVCKTLYYELGVMDYKLFVLPIAIPAVISVPVSFISFYFVLIYLIYKLLIKNYYLKGLGTFRAWWILVLYKPNFIIHSFDLTLRWYHRPNSLYILLHCHFLRN